MLSMSKQTDPDFLANEQYGDGADLHTRIRIQERYRTHPQTWFHWTFEHFEIPRQAHILELGCGLGDLWLENITRLQESWQVVLTDLSPGMVAETHRSPLGKQPNFYCAVLDMQAVPFEADTFDTVIGAGVLDHVPDRIRALNEIQHVLKPGGRFYTTTGSRTHLQEIETLVQPFLPGADYGGDPLRFGLENGEKLLSPWFTSIRRYLYDDELVFKQPEPIIDYVLSEADVRYKLQGEKKEAFVQFINQELALRREIRVNVNKGLFEAVKPISP